MNCYHAWTTKGEIKSFRSPHPIKVVGRSAWQSTDELWSYVSLPNSQRGQFHLTSSVSACAEGITHTLARCGVHPLPLFLSSFPRERSPLLSKQTVTTKSRLEGARRKQGRRWRRQGVSRSYECACMVTEVVPKLGPGKNDESRACKPHCLVPYMNWQEKLHDKYLK